MADIYAIIEFPSMDDGEENSIELVPMKWVTTDKKSCMWPPVSRMGWKKAVVSQMPVGEGWEKYDIVRIMETAGM